ncbi:MAG: hypothetical protein HN833_01045 [Elusimicrobiaceae bacterium]|jgi:hypothetical protein|nr:hypothetical protein [Elusimicrobiaceae bacterium]MBT3954855.1 hypothetical protein [Elusimicrobiaceae bacterium]MBT4008398.1 hypothetical protein [Elusimicrobiaceae bacterium]MBT4402926.1 hypothetical protein [Elusimicrobiaceae bacterium]MBT4439862.1 hypothetical protein [Elusimicrobiaceae bacterium]
MSFDTFLSKKLQKFSIVDIGFIKIVYTIVGLLLISLFQGLQMLHWGYFLTLTLIAVFPLYVNMFSYQGGYFTKARKYIQHNNPQKQVLLFLSMFGAAGILACFFPVLISYCWKWYVIAIAVFAIKPLTKSWYW